jgi:hypothetical protein
MSVRGMEPDSYTVDDWLSIDGERRYEPFAGRLVMTAEAVNYILEE